MRGRDVRARRTGGASAGAKPSAGCFTGAGGARRPARTAAKLRSDGLRKSVGFIRSQFTGLASLGMPQAALLHPHGDALREWVGDEVRGRLERQHGGKTRARPIDPALDGAQLAVAGFCRFRI